jgi:hypothetical protein
MTPAETNVVTYLVCPECGKGDGFRVDHLEVGRAWGPWSCDGCGLSIRGVRTAGGSDIEVVTAERPAHGLLLVRVSGSDPAVFMVIDHTVYRPSDETEGGMAYFVDEHTCPTNLVPVEAILSDGDCDPHGALEYVQWVPKPDMSDDDYLNLDWEGWSLLFDRLPGQTIEGSASLKRLPQ